MKVLPSTEYTIRCTRCGRDEAIINNDSEYRWNDTPSRYFRRQGWRTGPHGAADNICPVCARELREYGMGGTLR